MKSIFHFLFILIISSNCYSQKLKTYVHPTDGFEIGIPKKWDIEQHDEINLLVHASKYGKYYREDGTILVYIRQAGNATMDEIYKDYIEGLKRTEHSVSEVGIQDINDRRYFVYYTYKESGALPIKTIEYFTVKDNKIFTASFSSAEQNFNDLEPLFQKVAATIKY